MEEWNYGHFSPNPTSRDTSQTMSCCILTYTEMNYINIVVTIGQKFILTRSFF